jgi:hypothetical protein
MTRPALDRAVFSGRLPQIAQVVGTYDSKTDQTAQSDQHIAIAEQFGLSLAPELTTRLPKLTSGTAQGSNPVVQVAGTRIGLAHVLSSGAEPQP